MEIIHVLENSDDTYGWPARSVPYLCSQLKKRWHAVSLRTTFSQENESNIVCEEKQIPLRRFPSYWSLQMRFSPGLLRELLSHVRHATHPIIVHVHNLRNFPTLSAYIVKLCFPQKVKLIISPRWSLFARSLAQKKKMKDILWAVFQKDMLSKAECIHATSHEEKDAIHTYMKEKESTNIQVLSNGVELEEFDTLPTQQESRAYFELSEDKMYMLFLWRIHTKKWFDILIDCFVKSAQKFPKLHLLVAGMKEDIQLRESSMETLKEHNLLARIEDLGMVKWVERIYAYRSADVFMLPSHTENFGIVIAEALACEKLVITSDNTPWHELNALGAWYCIPLADFDKTLQDVLTCSAQERELLWKRWRAYVYEHFSWDILWDKYEQMYASLDVSPNIWA